MRLGERQEMTIIMDIQRFINQRKRLKLSQCKLCRGICTQATLSKFENNGRVPSLMILSQLCDRLGLTVDELYQQESIQIDALKQQLDDIERELMTEDYQDVIENLQRIDAQQLKAVPLKMQYLYLRGMLTALINGESDSIMFDFSIILTELDVTQKTIFSVLAFLGSGIMYDRRGQTDRAEFYFSKVADYIEQCQKAPLDHQPDRYYLRLLMLIYFTAEFAASKQHFKQSSQLIDAGVQLCSDQHVTFYLPRLKLLATQNAIALRRPTAEIQQLMNDTQAFARINRDQVTEVKLAALKRRLEKRWPKDPHERVPV